MGWSLVYLQTSSLDWCTATAMAHVLTAQEQTLSENVHSSRKCLCSVMFCATLTFKLYYFAFQAAWLATSTTLSPLQKWVTRTYTKSFHLIRWSLLVAWMSLTAGLFSFNPILPSAAEELFNWHHSNFRLGQTNVQTYNLGNNRVVWVSTHTVNHWC